MDKTLFEKYDAGSGMITPDSFRLLLQVEFKVVMTDDDIGHFADLCSLQQHDVCYVSLCDVVQQRHVEVGSGKGG